MTAEGEGVRGLPSFTALAVQVAPDLPSVACAPLATREDLGGATYRASSGVRA
jgi:hypothetical protein